ncbi:Aph-1 protein [Seminavis robusta]|uniref:Aph-1 protein n=1 Tax=Seminavis robusta TaxID=568900 RepID=A0A9N8DID8_9STRA|nr:Aph-1 protein [Seminavis robusta]|eukprot:Sro143_g066600.1 Aph-1 protein (317) ;mRNA; f:49488-50438
MTSFPLLLGCALVAFGPFMSLFFLVVYQKSQLVIIVTTSAFFFLVSALAGSFVWWLFAAVGLDDLVSLLLPGVLSQFIFRCCFVALYHKVEKVVRLCIEQEDARGQSGTNQDLEEYDENWTAAAKLRLQINDASCGVAAGVGFGGMHAIMLYGTLLASESGNVGVLYQESCPDIPSLAQSAVYALCFSIMDIFWMLLTFFGMRRRLLYHRGREFEDNIRGFGSYFGNSRSGGNLALMFVLLSHLGSSIVTVASFFEKGCYVTIPSLVGITLFTAYTFWAGTARIYMPPENSDQSISRTASRVEADQAPVPRRTRMD